MEEGDMGQKPEDELPPPPEEEFYQPRVRVLKPFKPTPRVSRIVRQGKCYYHPAKPASYLCASCGKSICTICGYDIGGAFFCPQCAPYESPPQVTSVTTPPPVSDTSWYRALASIGVILVLIGAILAFAYWPMTSMNAAEFENLMGSYWNEGGHNFKEYKPGDVIVVRDEISRLRVEYDPQWGVVTILWFDSTGVDDNDFTITFDADLEGDYHIGDVVSITLHIDEDTRTRDEVIRELNNNLPDISNLDHALSIDLVFYGMIAFGAFLIGLFFLFSKKVKDEEEEDEFDSSEDDIQDEPTESGGSGFDDTPT